MQWRAPSRDTDRPGTDRPCTICTRGERIRRACNMKDTIAGHGQARNGQAVYDMYTRCVRTRRARNMKDTTASHGQAREGQAAHGVDSVCSSQCCAKEEDTDDLDVSFLNVSGHNTTELPIATPPARVADSRRRACAPRLRGRPGPSGHAYRARCNEGTCRCLTYGKGSVATRCHSPREPSATCAASRIGARDQSAIDL